MRMFKNDFKLSVASGRKFLPEDFSHSKGQPISVLMGSAYAKIYSLGDTFTAYYLYSPFTFKIIGFLDSSCEISFSVGSTNLDKYIIMPSFSFADSPESETEYVTQKIHLANRTSGIVRTTEDNFASGWEQIEQLLNNSKVGNYSWTSSSIEKNLLLKGYNIRVLIPLCIFLSILFSILGLLLVTRHLTFKPCRYSVFRSISVSFVCICLSLFLSLIIFKIYSHHLGDGFKYFAIHRNTGFGLMDCLDHYHFEKQRIIAEIIRYEVPPHNTFPGFSIPAGSSASLIPFCTSTDTSPSASSKYAFLSSPIPYWVFVNYFQNGNSCRSRFQRDDSSLNISQGKKSTTSFCHVGSASLHHT